MSRHHGRAEITGSHLQSLAHRGCAYKHIDGDLAGFFGYQLIIGRVGSGHRTSRRTCHGKSCSKPAFKSIPSQNMVSV